APARDGPVRAVRGDRTTGKGDGRVARVLSGLRDGESGDGVDVGEGLCARPGAAVGFPDAAGGAAASGVITSHSRANPSRAQRAGFSSEPRTERGTSGVSGRALAPLTPLVPRSVRGSAKRCARLGLAPPANVVT